MGNCEIRSYIKKLPVSQTEQERLDDLHNEIGKDALKSKAFRKFNGKLYTRKYTYDKAMHFIASINKKYNSVVAKLAQISPNQHILKVNVSSLSKEIQGKLFASTDTLSSNQIQYTLKVINALEDSKVREPNKNFQGFLNDLRNVPKDQLILIKNTYVEGMSKKDLIASLLTNYNYTVEINTAKGLGDTFSLNNRYYLESFEDEISYYADIEGTEIITENVIKYRILNPNGAEAFEFENKIDAEKKLEELNSNLPNSNIYNNLTVPGGINYTENAHIIPELKGKVLPDIYAHHDQEFAQGNLDMYGWDRSDEQIKLETSLKPLERGTFGRFVKVKEVGLEDEDVFIGISRFERGLISKDRLLEEYGVTDDLQQISKSTKTRRILEIQSKFQKWRLNFEHKNNKYQILENQPTDKPNVFEDHYLENGKRITSKEYNKIFEEFLDTPTSKEDAFIKLIAKQWETMMIKSIIQDTAKQTITEVQESDVEAKIRELEKEGLLEIDCKGKLKAEKGLQTNFTKGGKWKLIKDLKGYPTHKEGGIDLTIGKDGVSIKNGNTQFTAKHGLVIPKAQDGLVIPKKGKNNPNAQDGSWFPSWVNPKNWGVTDYSDKGDFNTAYSAARKEGKKEFLFKDNRYSTAMKPIAGDVVQKREDFEPINNWAATEAAGGKRRQETYGNLGDLYAYFAGQPLKSNTLHYSKYRPTNSKDQNAQYIAIKDDKFINEVLENYDRVFNKKELLEGEKEINPNTWAVSGYTRPTTQQLNKQKQSGKSGDLFFEKGKDHVSNAIGRYFLSKGKDDRGDYISYYDIFDRGSGKSDSKGLLTAPYEIYDRIYIKDYGDGQKKRMYYTDKELSELNIDKKDFDTLALQRELSNRGYKLPKSTKQDGSLDGTWGDETKNALLEYRKSQNKSKH